MKKDALYAFFIYLGLTADGVSANEEDALAVATTQLERRDDVVHFSSRMDENWTAPSPACILRLLISAIERRIT